MATTEAEDKENSGSWKECYSRMTAPLRGSSHSFSLSLLKIYDLYTVTEEAEL